jgi:predicted RNA binding protein YcfA (HicA-like mRNA interferase family)
VKLPRDVSGKQLVSGLKRLGYSVVRQTGAHIRLKRRTNGEQPVTVPNHKQIKVGTLDSILEDVEVHLGINREELMRLLRI